MYIEYIMFDCALIVWPESLSNIHPPLHGWNSPKSQAVKTFLARSQGEEGRLDVTFCRCQLHRSAAWGTEKDGPGCIGGHANG